MLIKLVVLGCDDGVNEVLRKLRVGDGFAVLDVDLAKNLVVPIDNYARRLHLLEVREVELCRLVAKANSSGNEGQEGGRADGDDQNDGQVKPGARIPGAVIAGELS